MKVLFIQHDHVSPLGPVGERFQQLGFEIQTLLVVPELNISIDLDLAMSVLEHSRCTIMMQAVAMLLLAQMR